MVHRIYFCMHNLQLIGILAPSHALIFTTSSPTNILGIDYQNILERPDNLINNFNAWPNEFTWVFLSFLIKNELFLPVTQNSFLNAILGVESNWNSFEIRSNRFKNLRFERAKNILKIRWKLVRNSYDLIRLQL